jgi:hypothetical protein
MQLEREAAIRICAAQKGLNTKFTLQQIRLVCQSEHVSQKVSELIVRKLSILFQEYRQRGACKEFSVNGTPFVIE